MKQNNNNFELTKNLLVNQFTLEDNLRLDFKIRFSKILISKRKELGWSQEMLSKMSGVSRVTITNIENVQRTVSIEVALKLLYALGMTIEFVDFESDDT